MTRALLVTARWPWPARRGDQLRAVQFLSTLRRAGCAVTLLAPRERGARPTVPQPWTEQTALRVETYRRGPTDRLRGVGRSALLAEPLQSVPFASHDLERRLRELAREHDLVVLQLARLGGSLSASIGDRVYVDLIDCLSLSFERRARCDRLVWRPLLLWESRRLRRAERRVLARSRGAAVVCERDRSALLRLDPRLAAQLSVVPLSVASAAGAEARAAQVPPRLILSGSLGYFVNRDAAHWLLGSIWPALRRARSGLILELAGSRIDRRLRRAALREGVEVSDTPSDLGARIQEADIALAPLRAGAGVPVKVLEAWARGVPVVASSWAAEGTLGRHEGELLVAGDPGSWVDSVSRLLDDHELRRRLTGNAAALLASAYSEAAADAALVGELRRLGML